MTLTAHVVLATSHVIPAKAGIQLHFVRPQQGSWIPACAGMTEEAGMTARGGHR